VKNLNLATESIVQDFDIKFQRLFLTLLSFYEWQEFDEFDTLRNKLNIPLFYKLYKAISELYKSQSDEVYARDWKYFVGKTEFFIYEIIEIFSALSWNANFQDFWVLMYWENTNIDVETTITMLINDMNNILDKNQESEISQFRNFSHMISILHQFRLNFKDLPYIPSQVFNENWKISSDYNIIKKGTAYHIVYIWWNKGWLFQESFDKIENVVCSISALELANVHDVHKNQKEIPVQVYEFIRSQNI